MALSVLPSKSLAPSCKAGEIWLHSPYDPEREASRFVAASIGSSRPTHVVLLGPCLDYLTTELRRALPGARLVAIQYSAFFAGKDRSMPDAAWHPGLASSLEAFLDSNLDEDAISGVAVLEWEPASRAFPEEAALAKRAVASSLDRLGASVATVKTFGKRWMRNACASFLLIEEARSLHPGSGPIVVAASGPSLNAALEVLCQFRGSFTLIAVSSALAACREFGLEPDAIVSTDGGYWSRLHLYPLAGLPGLLTSPLTALPSSGLYRRSSFLLVDQGSFVEAELVPKLGPSLPLPPHGTVSGTALHLAARATAGPIIVAGLDLASYGDLGHARPNGFDGYTLCASSRLETHEGSAWKRGIESAPQALHEKPWRGSRALGAYASSLPLEFHALQGRLFRLFPSPRALPSFEPIAPGALRGLLGGGSGRDIRFPAIDLLPLDRREEELAASISAWRSLSTEAAEGMGKGKLPESPLVAELLRSVDIVDYAAARRAILAGGDPTPAASDLAELCADFLGDLQRRFSA